MDDYYEIPLTRGQVAKVSPWRYEELSQFKWCAHWDEKMQSYYAVRGFQGEAGRIVHVRMHRHILGLGYRDVRRVDHINRDTLDNRDGNLRIATHAQNMCNRKVPRNNTSSGIKGVSWFAKNRKYMAYITVDGKRKHLGYFSSLDDAATARYLATQFLHGEFGREG